jgi:hypothetical protein
MRIAKILTAVFIISVVCCVVSFAQDDRPVIDKSKIPAEGRSVSDFVPPGWKLEEQVTGDLNGDSVPDYALKLVEDKPAKNSDDIPNERQRALVILFKGHDGQLSRAAVADRLLQCTSCGGAFYMAVEAPANVKIEKGVLIAEQEHGSREVTDTTYRFRYEPESKKFGLIGFDINSNDRLTGELVTESTNYLTGVRVVTRGKGNRITPSRKSVPKEKIYIEDADSEQLEGKAVERLGI